MQKKFLAGAAALVALGLSAGGAFTAGNTVVDSVAGYGTSTVSGAVTTGVKHTLSGDGTTITGSTITFQTAQTGRTVKAGFGSTALQGCELATDALSATCTYATSYTTKDAAAFAVAVS